MKKLAMVIMLMSCICLLSGCADVQHVSGLSGQPAGFWRGLWHGAILPFSFIGRLFIDNIAVYAVNNTGGWYDFGFLIGVGWVAGGSSRVAR